MGICNCDVQLFSVDFAVSKECRMTIDMISRNFSEFF